MEKITHTPTPWAVDGYNLAGVIVKLGRIGEWAKVAECDEDDHFSVDMKIANAAYIVKACNSHAKLVEALKGTTESLQLWLAFLRPKRKS